MRVVVAGREKKEEAKTNAREPLASPFSAGSVGGGGSPGTAIVFVVLFYLFFVDVSLINLSSDTHKNWENSEAMGRASAHSRWTPGPYLSRDDPCVSNSGGYTILYKSYKGIAGYSCCA